MGLLAGWIWGLDGAHRQQGACRDEVGVSGSRREGMVVVVLPEVGGPDGPVGKR